MESNFESLGAKVIILLVCVCAGIFSIAIALATQYINIKHLPIKLIYYAFILQFILSTGVFIFVVLFFNSNYLPQFVSNDLWTMLTTAYFAASVPEIIITTALIIFSKEINKLLKERYGDEQILPMRNFEDIKGNAAHSESCADLTPEVPNAQTTQEQPKVCEHCGGVKGGE